MKTYKSRFGYHSIDYATFLKLKKLYKAYWQTVYDIAKWKRWVRKRPENRRGPEPTYCEAFAKWATYWKKPTKEEIQKYAWTGLTDNSCGVWEAFQTARMPAATEQEVKPCKLSDTMINFLLLEVEKYEASKAA
jgi:hypothetical protein